MTTRAKRIERVLTSRFEPEFLSVVDDSARHAGHAGAQPSGETHFNVLIVADRFETMSRVSRSRVVHEVLAPEFENGLHALSLVLRTPKEDAAVRESR